MISWAANQEVARPGRLTTSSVQSAGPLTCSVGSCLNNFLFSNSPVDDDFQ